MKERLVRWLHSLTAKYVAVFTLLVAVPAIGISWYLLDSSYNDNKAALVREQQQRAGQLAREIDMKLENEGNYLAGVVGSLPLPQIESILIYLIAADPNRRYVEFRDSHDRVLAHTSFGMRGPGAEPTAEALRRARDDGVFFGEIQPQAGGFTQEGGSDSSGFSTIDLEGQTVNVVGDMAIVRHLFHGTQRKSGDKVKLFNLTIWLQQQGQWKLVARQAAKLG